MTKLAFKKLTFTRSAYSTGAFNSARAFINACSYQVKENINFQRFPVSFEEGHKNVFTNMIYKIDLRAA